MDYDLDNRIIKVDVDNNDLEKDRRLVGILDLVSEANVARRVSTREAAANQVQIYNANGTQVATTQIDNHILWNTRRRDEVTGYYLYKYRHYSAELGRWLARDPIEESGGINLYAFCYNSTFNWWDNTGKTPNYISPTMAPYIDQNKDGISDWRQGFRPINHNIPVTQYNCGGLAFRTYENMDDEAILKKLNEGRKLGEGDIECSAPCEIGEIKCVFYRYKLQSFASRYTSKGKFIGTNKLGVGIDYHVACGSGRCAQKNGPSEIFYRKCDGIKKGDFIPYQRQTLENSDIGVKFVKVLEIIEKKCFCIKR